MDNCFCPQLSGAECWSRWWLALDEGWTCKIRDYSSPTTAVLVIFTSVIDRSTYCTSERWSRRYNLSVNNSLSCSFAPSCNELLLFNRDPSPTVSCPRSTHSENRCFSSFSSCFPEIFSEKCNIWWRVSVFRSYKETDWLMHFKTMWLHFKSQRERVCARALGGNCFKNGSEIASCELWHPAGSNSNAEATKGNVKNMLDRCFFFGWVNPLP